MIEKHSEIFNLVVGTMKPGKGGKYGRDTAGFKGTSEYNTDG